MYISEMAWGDLFMKTVSSESHACVFSRRFNFLVSMFSVQFKEEKKKRFNCDRCCYNNARLVPMTSVVNQ